MNSSDRRICVLFNADAGSVSKVDRALWARLTSAGESVELGSQGWRERVQRALSGQCRLIAAGGDGTVHTAANLLVEKSPGSELAIVPVGTGNDLARALNIPIDDIEQAIDLALHGPSQPADAVQIRHSTRSAHFINACYAGFGGRVADEVAPESKARWGLLPHMIQLAKQMIDMPAHETVITTDAGAATMSLHGLLVANSCYLGGGLPSIPQARVNDGLINVALVPVQSLWDRFMASVECLRGKIDESERTLTFETSSFSVTATPEYEYTMDGEAGPCGPVTFQCLPGAIHLIHGPNPAAFKNPDSGT